MVKPKCVRPAATRTCVRDGWY